MPRGYGWWVGAAALAALLVGGSYAYLMAIGIGGTEAGDDWQGFEFELAISLVTLVPALLIVAFVRAPSAVAAVGAAGTLVAAINCVFILAGGMPSWNGKGIALPPAVVGLLFAEAARRAWRGRRDQDA